MTDRELILLPVLSANAGPGGGLVLTQKYLDGAAEYAKTWPGPVTTLARVTQVPIRDMDPAEALPGTGPTGVERRPPDGPELAARLKDAAAAIAFLGPEEEPTLDLCNRIGVPVIFISEYAPKTERQIVDTETRNPVLRVRRKIWLAGAERKRRRMLPKSSGLQCSGTPTYDLYRELQPNALLFFDNRVREADVLSRADLDRKIAEIMEHKPLRLVFGGRLAAMKGVRELPRIARALHDLGVPFTLDIVGSGPLEGELAAALSAPPLSDHVTLHGPMDFREGWTPYLKTHADLFICPHPQGDPASTYPEVMSCGVVMAGYANEAFAGIAKQSGTGFLSPIGDAAALARVVADLHENRRKIADAAVTALEFARAHAFEPTFARRVEHMIGAARL